MSSKRRLDTLLAERGLFASRSRAAASVMAGEVYLDPARPERRRAQKPGELVAEDVRVSVERAPAVRLARGDQARERAGADRTYASQGGARSTSGPRRAGSPTACCSVGAAEVAAVDVGYGELDYGLRNDPRVHVLERTNARALTAASCCPTTPDLATVDVSFISLAKVLPAVLACMAERYDVLALVKPQFELGRGRVGKGGVVRDADDRREALVGVGLAARELGAAVLGYRSSGSAGPQGQPRDLRVARRARPPGRGRRRRGASSAWRGRSSREGGRRSDHRSHAPAPRRNLGGSAES